MQERLKHGNWKELRKGKLYKVHWITFFNVWLLNRFYWYLAKNIVLFNLDIKNKLSCRRLLTFPQSISKSDEHCTCCKNLMTYRDNFSFFGSLFPSSFIKELQIIRVTVLYDCLITCRDKFVNEICKIERIICRPPKRSATCGNCAFQ